MFEDLKKIPELSSIKDNNSFYEASFNKENILKLFQELKNSELFSFDQLIDITAIDYPSREKRFELIYIFLSMKKNKRIILRTSIKENDNLDALEESDDEDEFENIDLDKFVNLEKCVHMECIYNKKLNKYIPIKINDKGRVANKSDFSHKYI